MGAYIKFVFLNFLKKKPAWVCAALLWIFTTCIVIIVPLVLKTDYLFIWNNSMIEIQMFSVFILSVICAVVATQIFRDPIDDGSELVVVSKPISRWKLILGKFIVFWTTIFTILILNCVLILIGACMPNNNFDKFGKTIGTFFLGSIISAMLFGAVAVLISCFRSKVVILCSTIGLGVVLNIMNTILPLISNPPSSYIKDKYGYKTQSVIFVDKEGNERSYAAIKDLQKNSAMSSYDFFQEADRKSAIGATNILNVGGQLTDAYYLTPEDTKTYYSPYGFLNDEHYKVKDEKLIDSLVDEEYRPIFFSPYNVYMGDTGVPSLVWSAPGINDQNSSYSVQKLTSNSTTTYFGYTEGTNSLFPDSYYSYYDIGEITDIDFVNYIIDKYIWDGAFTQQVLNPFSGKDAITYAWMHGMGLLNYYNNNDDDDVDQVYLDLQALLTKNTADYDNYDVWDSYEVTNNTAVWPGVTQDGTDYHYPFNFEKAQRDDDGNVRLDIFHDVNTKTKDLNIVSSDTDADKSKYVKTYDDGKEYFNVAHYLEKALGPYLNPGDEQKMYQQKMMKLCLLFKERWSQVFWDGSTNPHYPLVFNGSLYPLNNTVLNDVWKYDRNSKFNSSDIINAYINTHPGKNDKETRRSIIRPCTSYGALTSYNKSKYVYRYNYSPLIPADTVPFIDQHVELHFYYTQIKSSDLENFYRYDIEHYMNKVDVTIFWAFFSFGLFIVVVVVYTKTDFK